MLFRSMELSPDRAASAALEVRTARLSPGWLEAGRLCPFRSDGEGWWRSGDAARLEEGGLIVLGRLDGALQSGGESVFPEVLEARLEAAAAAAALRNSPAPTAAAAPRAARASAAIRCGCLATRVARRCRHR